MNTVLLLLSGIHSDTIFFMIYCKKKNFWTPWKWSQHQTDSTRFLFQKETSLFRHCDGRNYSPEIQIVLFYLVNFQVNALAQYWNLTGHLQLGVNVQHFAVQQEFKVVFALRENKQTNKKESLQKGGGGLNQRECYLLSFKVFQWCLWSRTKCMKKLWQNRLYKHKRQYSL